MRVCTISPKQLPFTPGHFGSRKADLSAAGPTIGADAAVQFAPNCRSVGWIQSSVYSSLTCAGSPPIGEKACLNLLWRSEHFKTCSGQSFVSDKISDQAEVPIRYSVPHEWRFLCPRARCLPSDRRFQGGILPCFCVQPLQCCSWRRYVITLRFCLGTLLHPQTASFGQNISLWSLHD